MHDQYIWVVDPVDGTYNFVHGNQNFGVMVALVYNGQTIASWIYDVCNDAMTVAEIGSGAYQNGVRLHIKERKPAHEMLVHLSIKFFPKTLQAIIKEKRSAFGSVKTIGSAAHEYLNIAKDISQCALYCRLKPWDHLPGALIVEEAGGFIQKWDRTPYTPYDRYAGLIVTTDQDSWDAIYGIIFGDIDIQAYL